jgi:N-acetylneuraminic acid mutarotase
MNYPKYVVYALMLLSAVFAQDWQEQAVMPTARSEMQAVHANGFILVAGGLGFEGAIYDTFEAFDLNEGVWRSLPNLPKALHHAALAVNENTVYVSGGYDDLEMTSGVKQLYSFNLDRQSWQRLRDMPAPRAAHVMLAYQGGLYVLGGITNDFNAVWRYDISRNRWQRDLSPLPTAREHLAAAVIGNEIYAVGGRFGDNQATLEIYNIEADTWRNATPMPTARGGLTAAALNGRLHVIGGEVFRPLLTYSTHEIYDPVSDSWLSASPLPQGRHGLASVTVGGKLFVIGGAFEAAWDTLTSVTGSVIVYEPEGN